VNLVDTFDGKGGQKKKYHSIFQKHCKKTKEKLRKNRNFDVTLKKLP